MSDGSNRSTGSLESDLSGRMLGDYRLLRRLGRGAMAEVYLAEQCSLSRQVAVKVLRADLACDQTFVKRFQREAQAAASLVHANIVQIHEVGRVEPTTYFIAQEYVQGVNLRQWIARNGTLDLRMSLLVIRQVAAALAKAADHGIVHRDIKPENIMLAQSGEVKVADFGLARLPGVSDGVDLTQAGITMGTPLYMSPEQVEGKPLDPRSDLYSLGVTCYQMLAGSPPFTGETALAVAVQHLKRQPEPLENRRPDLPPALCRLVHRLLAKSPDARYVSARELLRELHQIHTEHLGDAWPDDLPGWESAGLDVSTGRLERTQRLGALMRTSSMARPRKRPWIYWLLGVGAAFLAGGLAAFWTVREPSLVAELANRPREVPRQASVAAQWLYANQVGTEEAWRAVSDYFPTKVPWAYRAKQRLAGIYLKEEKDQEAMKLFKEFADLDDTEPELRAFGLAGECWVLTRQHKYRESADVLTELLPIRSKLSDPLMRQMLNYVIRKNVDELGPLTTQQWQEWLDKQPTDDGSG